MKVIKEDSANEVRKVPERIKKATELRCLEEGFLYTNQIVPYVDSGMSAGTLLVSRGCWAGCRFCQEGETSLPYRELDLQVGMDSVKEAVRTSGARSGMLSAFCSSSFTSRKRMTKMFLESVHNELGFISQRVDETAKYTIISFVIFTFLFKTTKERFPITSTWLTRLAHQKYLQKAYT